MDGTGGGGCNEAHDFRGERRKNDTPASIAAQLKLRRGLHPGVWAPEEFFDVEDYFSELRKRHIAIVVEETEL